MSEGRYGSVSEEKSKIQIRERSWRRSLGVEEGMGEAPWLGGSTCDPRPVEIPKGGQRFMACGLVLISKGRKEGTDKGVVAWGSLEEEEESPAPSPSRRCRRRGTPHRPCPAPRSHWLFWRRRHNLRVLGEVHVHRGGAALLPTPEIEVRKAEARRPPAALKPRNPSAQAAPRGAAADCIVAECGVWPSGEGY